MIIREATGNDNNALLDLTKACPMDGTIKLLIDRQPDFFSLLKIKGNYKLLVAENEGAIVGSFALVIKHAYIDGVCEQIGYLCDLKIDPDYRNSWAAFRLLQVMHEYMKSLSVKVYLCVTANGNQAVQNLLTGRLQIPAAQKRGNFNVYQWLPLKREPKLDVNIVKYSALYKNDVLSLLNRYYSKFQFASVFEAETNIEGDEGWLYLENKVVVAFLSVKDMENFKQNRVIGIPNYLKVLLILIKLFWSYVKVPKEKQSIPMLSVQYFAYDQENEKKALLLLKQARHYLYTRKYTFLSYGVDARNPLVQLVQSLPSVMFHSLGFVFDFRQDKKWDADRPLHDNFYQI